MREYVLNCHEINVINEIYQVNMIIFMQDIILYSFHEI